MVLIDTSAFIEFLNHTGSPFDREIERIIVNDEDVAIADIVLTEILQGIRDDKEYNAVKKSLLSFPIYSLKSHDSYIAAAELYRKCRKKGITLRSTVDLLIAQIAIENDLLLLHNDKDFDSITRISSLKVYKLTTV
ncbi:MAG: PIN domain nuclease [Nitrospirae bacterium]|nr:PIN domain nuclease [Nitrospirota bacterium]MDA8340444.1 PIN domain nuclease [Nitrospiraceae bacterium]